MNFNKAIIVGRVTVDPEARTTPGGQSVTSFGVATNRYWTNTNGEKQEKVEFHNVVAWGKLADICGQYVAKGMLILIEGRLETHSWDGQDGVKRFRTEIIAENMQMGPRAAQSGGGAPAPAQQAPAPEESAPAPGAPQPEVSPQNPSQGQNPESEEEIKIEDIPF